jgi:hypothetical protein
MTAVSFCIGLKRSLLRRHYPTGRCRIENKKKHVDAVTVCPPLFGLLREEYDKRISLQIPRGIACIRNEWTYQQQSPSKSNLL